MLRGLILDLDGVIVDSHPAHRLAWAKFFKSLGREVSDPELEFVLEGQKREEILHHFLGRLTPEQVNSFAAQKDAFFSSGTAAIKVIPGLIGFLGEVDAVGLPAAVASSAGRSRVYSTLQQLNLVHHFQTILAAEDVAKGKPDPAIFIRAAESIRVRPNEILVCEDGISGVAAAKAAGMKCLAIAADGRGARLQEAGADKVVPDFSTVHLDDLRALFA